MFEGDFAYALVAGMAATVNPCGFALLPAYLAAFVGLDDRPDSRLGRLGAVGRALAVSAVLTLGFITVFALFGAVLLELFEGIWEQLPWMTIVIGLVLVVMAIWLLSGRSLTIRLPHVNRGGADGTLASMYLFGVSYAVASVSCTIGVFIGATTTAVGQANLPGKLLLFVTYGVGMGTIVTVLTVAVALARDGVVARFRRLLPWMNRISGGLMLVAGLYIAYYGWYEYDLLYRGGDGDDAIVGVASDIRNRLVTLLPTKQNGVWWLVAAIALIGAAWWWTRSRPTEPDPPVDDPDPDRRVEVGASSG